MKAQTPHAALVPIAQHFRRDARVGDGDAAQPLRKTLQRIEHHAIVVDVGVTLHHEAIGEAEVIQQRDQPLDRRVGFGCGTGPAMRGGSSAVATPQPNLMLASLTTRLHSAIWASMKAPNS